MSAPVPEGTTWAAPAPEFTPTFREVTLCEGCHRYIWRLVRITVGGSAPLEPWAHIATNMVICGNSDRSAAVWPPSPSDAGDKGRTEVSSLTAPAHLRPGPPRRPRFEIGATS